MMESPYLCALYVATAGQQGANLGADEEEIVLLVYVVVDMLRNEIVSQNQYLVKPRVADINENVLSEQLVGETYLTEELVKNGQPLEAVIQQFDQLVRAKLPAGQSLRLVTDGQLPLRQCLHPEACSKGIDLPHYYTVFHDLRKDFQAFYGAPDELQSITDMVTYLGMTPAVECRDFYVREVKDMVNIVQRLLADGHKFDNPEIVSLRLEPGICSKNEEVDNNCVVRARGLPWQSSDQDIAKFFRGLNVAKGGVALCLSPQGRRNGEALVRFVNQEHRDMALKRHKHHIGNRYIEVYRASGEDFINVAGGNNNEAQAFLSKGGQVIVRMRGLPYDCTAKQVLEFFDNGENSCKVMDDENGVLFVKKPDGRATGDAFVLFSQEEDAAKALSKHRELIGSRYIELFRSTTAEVQQVLNRSMDPKTYEQQPPLISQIPQVPLLPQHLITSGTRKDCIRLRGLPYEAQVEHILEFLCEHAKNIVFQGVHMVYNAQGQPSGEAFIQMDSEQSAYNAATQKHHRYMTFGKKQRYIEVFQCSGEDMNMVLTGGIPTGAVSPGKATALLSPGMLAAPPPPVAPTPIMLRPPQQDSLWFVNPLAVQQQQHQQQAMALALAAAAAKQSWGDLNGSSISSGSLTAPTVSVSTAQAAKPLVPTPATAAMYSQLIPSVAASHFPAAAAPPGFVLVNIPRMPQILPQGAPTLSTSTANLQPKAPPNHLSQGATAFPPNHPPPPPHGMLPPIMHNPTAAAIMGLKRSWEQAFPTELQAAAAAAAAGSVKRPWQPTSASMAATFRPQTAVHHPATIAYQTQFYPAL